MVAPVQRRAKASEMAVARQISEQLRRFLTAIETPTASANLSDVGFLLLTLKDQLLLPDQRAEVFIHDFISRPISGVDLLMRIIVALQGLVNSTGSSSKISNILGKNSSANSRKRKAAVAEADSIECLKILLEKSAVAWRSFLENQTNLEVILYSVNSPQLDSKCYALEIVLLLLDQSQGFSVFWRTLTLLAARNRDYLRLSIFIAQLKHGLHTHKLHIQILVVRLLNKLLGLAPSTNHRLLAQIESSLAQFSPDHLEKLVLDMNTPLGGLEILVEELALYRSYCIPMHSLRYENGSSSKGGMAFGYSHSESESDSSKGRRLRNNNNKFTAQAGVGKNVERRMRRHEGSGGRSAGEGRGPHGGAAGGYYPARSTHSNTFNSQQEEPMYQSSRNLRMDSRYRDDGGGGGMRRAKSESAMQFADDNDDESPRPTRLKRMEDSRSPDYNPLQSSRMMSRSIHDLSRRSDDDRSTSLQRPSSRPPSAQEVRTRSLQRTVSPPRARFAEPPSMDITPSSQQPHGGFSYLFPAAPVVANVVNKRPVTPSASISEKDANSRPSSRAMSPRGAASPSASSYTSNARSEGQVTYIPINVENKDGAPLRRYEKRDDRPSKSPAGPMSEDVRDALSQFDYLNEYEGGSSRGQPSSASFRDF